MLSNKFYAVQAEIYWDMRRKADHDRLVQMASGGRQAADNIVGRALAWLGRRLVAWGKSLQECDGSASTPQSACQPVQRGAAI